MEYNLILSGFVNQFDVSLHNVQVASDSLIPRISFSIRVVRQPQQHPETPEISLSSILAEIFVNAEKESGTKYIGTAFAMQSYTLIGEQIITLYLDLDYYKIQQIEKIRKGEDFKLELKMRGFATGIRPNVKTGTADFSPAVMEYELPKSKWIEKFLKRFDFKHVRLFEFPEILPSASLSEAIKHLDDGWTQFSSGHYNKVLADCRLALEEVSTIVKKAGFKRNDKDDKGEEIEVPDWKKIFESGSISDPYRHIFQKLMGFAALGAHTGKSINIEDALFALMITHALIYYLVEKYPS